MKSKYLTGRWELSCLIINLIIYKVFTDAPRRFMESGTSAFLAALVSAAIAYAVIWFLPCVYKKADVKNIFELFENNVLATLLSGIIILSWLILSGAHALESLVTFSKIAAFPSAPFVFIAMFFVLAFAAAVLRGMDGAVRPHALIVPFYIFMILFMLSSVIRYFDVTNLLPVFGEGIKETFFVGVKNISYFFDFILIFLINPFIKEKENLVKTVRISGAVGIFVNLLIILSINLLLPYPASGQVKFPVYQIMKNVYFGRFFQRIDAVYLLSVTLSGMGYLSFIVFLMTYVFKKVFRLENNRPFVWTFSFIVLFLAMLIHKRYTTYLYNLLMIFEGAGVVLIALAPLMFISRRSKK